MLRFSFIINMLAPEYPELLDKLFVIEDKNLRVQISIFKQICSCNDYKRLIDITLIFQRLFQTSKQHLTIRELIGDSIYPHLNNHLEENKVEKRIDFFIDSLNNEDLISIISQLQIVRKKLKYSIYSIKLMNIVEMLKHSLKQVQKQAEKKEMISNSGDFEVIQEQYKKIVVINQEGLLAGKLNQIFKNPKLMLDGKFSNSSTLMNFIASELIPQFQKSILSIPLLNHTDRQSEILKVLNFIYRYFIPQYQIQIEISKNTLVETRIYLNRHQKELLYINKKLLLGSLKKIINESILCPYSINIQIILLRILRRLYYLIDNRSINSSENLQHTQQLSTQQLTNNITRNPLYLTMRNIALFSEGKEEEYREASMLMYKIVQDKNDIEFITLLEGCQELRFLKNSKYFSSKAYAYANEIEKIYQPMQLGNLYLKNYQLINSRAIWVYTFIVEKPSTLLSWQFYLAGYDIKFGIYKTQHLRDLSHEQYDKGTDCRQLIKSDKIQNSQAHPNKGHLYVKNGVYRFVFDNSFSIMRNKQLIYTFLQLECVI